MITEINKRLLILKEENDKRVNKIKELIEQLRIICLTEKSIILGMNE